MGEKGEKERDQGDGGGLDEKCLLCVKCVLLLQNVFSYLRRGLGRKCAVGFSLSVLLCPVQQLREHIL